MLKKPEADTDFLKTPLLQKILFELCPDLGNKAKMALSSTIPVVARYIFKHKYKTDFVPTLLGDVLLIETEHLDRHLTPQHVESLAEIFWQRGFSLGQMADERAVVTRIRGDFRRANYYSPRESLLVPTGIVIDMNQPVVLSLPQPLLL